MGYRLCAFLDADEPVEIFRRLLVGSEGTLAFIAEAVFETVPQPPHTTISWLHFDGIDSAVAPVPELVAAGATAVELMVAPALIVAPQLIPGTPEHWGALDPESAALLVEFGADDPAGLDESVARAEEILGGHGLLRPSEFTREHDAIELAWSVREGMFGLMGKLRPPGTALITEDVCVPPERIAEAATDVRRAAGRARFPDGRRGPRLGRQPALHAHAGVRRGGRPRPLRGVHGRAGGPDPRQVRRLAEGRARNRAEHGSLPRARVGGEGDRDDVARSSSSPTRTAC